MYEIDATNKKLGRVAQEAASVLMGKNTTSFAKNTIADVKVNILNASKADISEKKLEEVEYTNYTGYPGGLRKTPMKRVVAKKGYSEIFKKAIYGMIPPNRLRSKIMKNLTVSE